MRQKLSAHLCFSFIFEVLKISGGNISKGKKKAGIACKWLDFLLRKREAKKKKENLGAAASSRRCQSSSLAPGLCFQQQQSLRLARVMKVPFPTSTAPLFIVAMTPITPETNTSNQVEVSKPAGSQKIRQLGTIDLRLQELQELSRIEERAGCHGVLWSRV